MATFYVLKTGETVFEVESRIESASGSKLTPEGTDAINLAAQELQSKNINAIYCSKGEAEYQTAGMIGKTLGLKVRVAPNLRELDYGLWQGLTVDEIRRRQPKVYRQWTEQPTTVCPPGGETLQEAQKRVCESLRGIIKRQKKDKVPLIVLRPVVLGLLRCALEQKENSAIWKQKNLDCTWCSYETVPEVLIAEKR